jgi:hypothetical protein
MSAEQAESVAGLLIVELLESAINLALAGNREALARLMPHTGKVVRVKTLDPHAVFYLTLCEDGVALATHHEERVDARIRLPAGDLARLFIRGPGAAIDMEGRQALRFVGDEELLADLFEVAIEFDLWHLTRQIVQQWLPEFRSFDDLLRFLRDQDPAWMARLEHLPQLTHEAWQSIKELQVLQQRQMEELVRLREQLDRDRRAGQVSTVIGFILMVMAFGFHAFPSMQSLTWAVGLPSLEHSLLIIVALVLLVPRLMGRR